MSVAGTCIHGARPHPTHLTPGRDPGYNGARMATRNPLARGKRERERARAEKQKEKAARRAEARARRGAGPGEGGGEDPDIAGIVPGPQANPWGDEPGAADDDEADDRRRGQELAGSAAQLIALGAGFRSMKAASRTGQDVRRCEAEPSACSGGCVRRSFASVPTLVQAWPSNGHGQAGSLVCVADACAPSGLHADRRRDARARAWGEHGDVHRRPCGAAAAAAVSQSGRAREDRRPRSTDWRSRSTCPRPISWTSSPRRARSSAPARTDGSRRSRSPIARTLLSESAACW